MKTRSEYLTDLLSEELEKLYHNATLGGKLTTASDFEADLLQDQVELECQFAFERLETECPEILHWGQVYQWGRGGRTVAPEKLIESRGFGWRISKAYELDLSDQDTAKLIRALRAFNQLVKDFCETVSDQALEYIRSEYQDQLKENAGKTRQHYSGVRYV